ncbi:MAG: CAP domain-containing protein [Patescibacteria group bacterium]|nr:CAP domain-containing protein [Patescibacteria group bacterium]
MSENKNTMQAGFFQPANSDVLRELKDFWRGFFDHVQESFVPHHKNNYHPHIFSQRMTALLSVLLVCVKLFTVAALSLGPALPAFSADLTPANIISLTNASRQTFGLKALAENGKLDAAAQAKAADMLQNQYFAHTSPQGKTPWNFIHAADYGYLVAGENLAVNFTNAESVEQAWMNSPSHKANLLNKNYTEIGIGIAQGLFQGRQATFVVQMFGDPSVQKVELTSIPTPVQALSVPVPVPIAQPAGMAVAAASIAPDGDLMKVSAKTEGAAVKVLARFGERAIMLSPAPDNNWVGYVAASSLTASQSQLDVVAQDIQGATQTFKLAYFSPDVKTNYNVLGASITQPQISLFGVKYAPQTSENKFYLWFAVAMLSSLALAIGIRHRIQHPSLVMNGSLLVVLAMMLWMTG